MNTSSNPKPRVICRPGPMWIAIAALAALLGRFFVVVPRLTPRPVNDPTLTVLGATVLALAALVAVFHATSRVVADETGVRWKRFGFGGSVPWSDVHEYHLQDTESAARKPSLVIHTGTGRLVVPDLWTHQGELKVLLAYRAGCDPGDDWGILTGTDGRWRKVFTYNRRRAIVGSAACVTALAAIAGGCVWSVVRDIYRFGATTPWTSIVIGDSPLLLVVAMYTLLIWVIAADYTDSLKRKDQRISVDPDGITFSDTTQHVHFPWGDVTAIRLEVHPRLGCARRRMIISTNGEFGYTAGLGDVSLLNAIVRRMAVNAGEPRRLECDALGETEQTAGVTVHHYRTRSVRAVLWLPTALCPCLLLCGWLTFTGLAPIGNPTAYVATAVVSAALSAWGWLSFRMASIRTDSIGITHRGHRGETAIPWADVRGFRKARSGLGWVVTGSKAKIGFSDLITNYEALKAVIDAHVTGENGYNVM